MELSHKPHQWGFTLYIGDTLLYSHLSVEKGW
jgi:hypothetical protein